MTTTMATIRSVPLPKPEKAPVHKFALCAGIIAHAGALLAFVPAFFDWWAVLGCFVLAYFTGAIGISATYHRLLTHRSYSVRPRWVEYVLTIIGNLTMQGGALSWVADHRRHHAHTDEPLDVHTPRHGFWWSHIIWVITPEITAVHTKEYDEKWAPDLMKDPVHRFLNTWWFVFPIGLLGVLYALGGMPWLVWGGFVRTVLILHVTLLVNSATHRWGYRTYDTRDDSTNLWWVALLSYGEGWHNNHHAFQSSAKIGLRWWEIDTAYWAIKAMSLVGIAYNVKQPKLTRAKPNRDPLVPAAPRHDGNEPELVGAGA
jgi:stearoyl-CoA desaturase (delta-9 desaturase)